MISHRILSSAVARYGSLENLGQMFIPDFVAGLKERHSFWVAPESPTHFNLDDGARFEMGKHGELNIESLTIFRNGILVEAVCDTDALTDFVDELIQWAESDYSCRITDSAPVRQTHKSILEFQMESIFAENFDRFEKVSEQLNNCLGKQGMAETDFKLHGLTFSANSVTASPLIPSQFTIERRANIPREENFFFSDAPLRTAQHLEIISLFEELIA